MKKGIITGLIGIVSFAVGIILGGKMLVGMINDYKTRMQRNLSNMMLFNNWLEFIYSGGSIDQYFYNHGYKKIMIYGNGYIGKRLGQALSDTEVEVVAVMDKAALSDENDMVIGVDSSIPDVDCIVVTPVFFFDTIYEMLRVRTEAPVISIQVIIENDMIIER